MSLLDKLKKTKTKQSFLFYSKAGAGKTSFAAQFNKPIFLIDPKEDGLGDLQEAGIVSGDIPRITCESWEEVHEHLDDLLTNDYGFGTLVFDSFSATGFETLLFKYVADRHFDGDMSDTGFLSFNKGPDVSLPYLQAFTAKLERLREKMTIIILCHSRVGKYDDPKLGSYSVIQMQANQKVAEVLAGWASNVGYIDFLTEVQTDQKTKKTRGKGGVDRQLHFTRTATHEAKNRLGLTEPIEMGDSAEEAFANFSAAVKEAKAENKHSKTNK